MSLCKVCHQFTEDVSKRSDTATRDELAGNFHPEDGDYGVQDFILHFATSKNHLKCVQYLLDQGENLNLRSRLSERTPLMLAAVKGFQEMCKLLLCEGADVNALDKLDKTALMYAAANEHPSCVKILLDTGSLFELRDKWTRQTALNFATWNGDTESMAYLLDKGAKFGFFEFPTSWHVLSYGFCRLDIAVLDKVFDLIFAHTEALPYCVFLGLLDTDNPKLLEKIFNTKVPIMEDVADWRKPAKSLKLNTVHNFNSALHYAIEHERITSVEVLLKNRNYLGLDINTSTDNDARTPLQKACSCDRGDEIVDGDGDDVRSCVDLLHVLLKNGANPNILGSAVGGIQGRVHSPLFICLRTLAYNKYGLRNIALLIRYGCDVNQKCQAHLIGPPAVKVPLTPLAYALNGNNLYAARFLVLAGATNHDSMYTHFKSHKPLVHKDLACTAVQKNEFIQTELGSPPTLFRICRHTVRQLLPSNSDQAIRSLPVANILQNYLMFRDLDQVAEEFCLEMAQTAEESEVDSTELSLESMSSCESEEEDDDEEDDDDDDDDDEEDDDDMEQLPSAEERYGFPSFWNGKKPSI